MDTHVDIATHTKFKFGTQPIANRRTHHRAAPHVGGTGAATKALPQVAETLSHTNKVMRKCRQRIVRHHDMSCTLLRPVAPAIALHWVLAYLTESTRPPKHTWPTARDMHGGSTRLRSIPTLGQHIVAALNGAHTQVVQNS